MGPGVRILKRVQMGISLLSVCQESGDCAGVAQGGPFFLLAPAIEPQDMSRDGWSFALSIVWAGMERKCLFEP